MKKLFLLFLPGLLLVACNRNTNLPAPGNDELAVTNYLSLTLVAADRIGTRVDVDEDDYAYGTDSENAVKQVRFFFFAEDGSAAAVWKRKGSNGYESYLDWYPSDSNFGDRIPEETVEKIVHATLGISTPGETNPASVLAVINPSPDVLAMTPESHPGGETVYGPSLDQIRDAVADFQTGQTDGNFVMSNSVYVKDGKVVDAVALKDENFALSLEDAEKHAVVLFVERVIARLDLSIALTPAEDVTADGGPVYSTKADGNYTVDGKETGIYVQLLGWNVTGTAKESRLVKKVSEDWDDENFFSELEPWNIAQLHRSYWGINPAGFAFPDSYDFGMLKENQDAGNDYPAAFLPIPKTGESETAYLQENAAVSAEEAATDYPSKVIIAAKLVDEDGKAFPLAEWAYKKYKLTSLKDHFAGDILSALYKKTTGAEGATAQYDRIRPEDIDFKTASQFYGDEVPEEEGRYYVYPVLAEEVEDADWYIRGENGYTPTDKDAVNRYILDRINHVMVWNGGLTYYYFDIRHLGATPEAKPEDAGYYGVVRNHLYAAKVTSLTGLGTPVYDPDHEIIYPETPEYDESIVSATVKILQWRMVSQEYDLKWK